MEMTNGRPRQPDDASSAEATLRSARQRVDSLAVDDGQFHVACRASGVRPEPVTDATFVNRDDAEDARAAARSYRSALASLDPACARYDLDVYEADEPDVSVARIRETTDERRDNGLPASRQSVLLTGARADEWLRIENGPVVHVLGRGSLLDDEVVARQLDVKL